MDLARELVEQQVFFRRELSERVGWFIGLRWIAVCAALAGAAASRWAGLQLPLLPIVVIIMAAAGCNTIFFKICRRLKRVTPDHPRPFEICTHCQMVCDLAALFGLIHFTGGIFSPLALFVLFHIVLAAILLEPGYAFVYSGAALATLALMGVLQSTGGIDTHAAHLSPWISAAAPSLRGFMLVFVIETLLFGIVAFLVTTIKISLRGKGRTLLRFCKELNAANTKLTSLYGMIKELAFCAESQHLMDCATRNAARIMGVKACSIKLLADQDRLLRFASTYGLSRSYLTRGDVVVAQSPINQRIIDGAVYAIGNIEEQDYFQYPENILQEGIRSMICLPLKVEKRVLGVFCVYSEASFCFSDSDVDFFALMAEVTALAMQNLTNELNKNWFLQRAAHQLRSPINAVISMLKVLDNGYTGPLTEQQTDLLRQSEHRLDTLSGLVKDLLKLSLERSNTGRLELAPLDLGEALRACVAMFEPQAQAKHLMFSLEIGDRLPPVMGEDSLIDHVLTNLISNAVKYTPAGKRVAVALKQESGDRLRLDVTDEGIGIPEEAFPRLFSEFFRAENARTLTDEGSGLGLVIVKEAMDQMRGSVHVHSRPGEGTRVSCRFWVAVSHAV